MSDLGRKGLGEQVQEKVTPQSQKSTGQVIGENLTGAGDKLAGAVQPSSEKSTTQKAGDTIRGNTDSAENQGGGILENVQKTVTDTFNAVTGKADETAKKNDL
ncbi:putative 12 kDa heat shock protein [Leptodontidium sp. 2 PMI_412]|nr:putative 12 kDa heat shock protein [Leptodontidium sp. MPI-SDFR-AT-0119]KAH9224742.1 putative 12 kDa heat shock protein [Leptodontidium sp. 2 PMI_412]